MPVLKKRYNGRDSFATSEGIVRAKVNGDFLVVKTSNPKQVQQLINEHGFHIIRSGSKAPPSTMVRKPPSLR